MRLKLLIGFITLAACVILLLIFVKISSPMIRHAAIESYSMQLVMQDGFWKYSNEKRFFPDNPTRFVKKAVKVEDGVYFLDSQFLYRSTDSSGAPLVNDPSANDLFFLVDLSVRQRGHFVGVTSGLAVFPIKEDKELIQLASRLRAKHISK